MKILKHIPKVLLFLPLFFVFGTELPEVKPHKTERLPVPFLTSNTGWADSIFKTLSPKERLGQLFMITAYPKDGVSAKVEKLITQYKVGGLIMFQGNPQQQAKLTNHYQALSPVPLMIAGDYEWGLSMRLKNTIRYPRQMMLGAIQDDKIIYEMATDIARQLKRLGIHINFAPVIDVNNNPANPVINSRSFGEQRENVARKGTAYMFGLQDSFILATGKHFPGHGDTDMDSHYSLPVITHKRERLDSIEMYPFRDLIKAGLGGIMIAHLCIPALDNEKNKASSLSKKIVTDILKKELKFEGLIFTDALGMKGISSFYPPGIPAVKALLAGSDILLMPTDVKKAFSEIEKAIATGEITQKEIDRRCLKVLKAKEWFGLQNYKPVSLKNLHNDLNRTETKLIKRKIIENAITVAFNNNEILPFKKLDKQRIACVSVGSGKRTTFQNRVSDYYPADHFYISKNANAMAFEALERKLKKYDTVILGIHKTNRSAAKGFGVTAKTRQFANSLAEKTAVVLTVFGNPYILSSFSNLHRMEAAVVSYNNWTDTQDITAQILFGGIPAKGKLPVSVNSGLPAGSGFIYNKNRLKYSIPEELKIRTEKLKQVDSIIIGAIDLGAFPGCTVLAAKDGIVFYHKSFGSHTYKKKVKTKNTDLYDLASLTKITATLPSIMKLQDEKKIDVNKKLSVYLTELDTTNKKYIKIRDILTHQARLRPWIPFYWRTFSDRKKGILDTAFYSTKKTKRNPYKVADNLYVTDTYEQEIFRRIYDTKLRRRKRYKYSDMGFIMLYRTIEKITKRPLENYTFDNFYAPLGAYTLGYKPLERFSKNSIVPTENDTKFRKQLLQGYVHDYAAALTDLVNGHAGLFGTANDLAKIMQMYMQYGIYGGKRYISEATLKKFTACQYCPRNRRALGFDKLSPSKRRGPPTSLASKKSFGHTGFTGTMVWADPENQLVYIFLSNRINPYIANRLIISENVRAKVQRVFYEAIEASKK